MLTLALGTAALFIVLSVFNGLSNLITNVHQSFDAQLEISPASGKVLSYTQEQLVTITNVDGVLATELVVEDDAFINYKQQQKVVKVFLKRQEY